ncbi:MAG: prepilin peptidase, partial [Planctomycetes bacterium]|nr:prepilin peptidase [Planctomycetota bacterium]
MDELAARQYVFHILVGAWVFSVGATVGSFLNVVVYRLPAGKSLVRPGSRCPKCNNPIRPIHNIPILGWFILRGRCWDCGLPISPRYPLVETLVALAFLLLAVCELLTQGANLPVRDPAAVMYWGRLWA